MPFEDLFVYTPHELIYTFLLPFIIVFAIFFGVLSSLRIFGKRINLVLSLAFTIAAAYGGLFTIFASYMMSLGAYVGIGAFVIVFILGVAMWAFGRGRETYYDYLKPEDRVKKISEKIEKLYDELERTGDPSKKRALIDTIKKLEVEKELAARAMHR